MPICAKAAMAAWNSLPTVTKTSLTSLSETWALLHICSDASMRRQASSSAETEVGTSRTARIFCTGRPALSTLSERECFEEDIASAVVLAFAERRLVWTDSEERPCIPVTMTFILEATARVRSGHRARVLLQKWVIARRGDSWTHIRSRLSCASCCTVAGAATFCHAVRCDGGATISVLSDVLHLRSHV